MCSVCVVKAFGSGQREAVMIVVLEFYRLVIWYTERYEEIYFVGLELNIIVRLTESRIG